MPVGDAELISLTVRYGVALQEVYGRPAHTWIAHFHAECWHGDDGARDDVVAAACTYDFHWSEVADPIDSIGTATQQQIDAARERHHRQPDNDTRPFDDTPLHRVLWQAKIPSWSNLKTTLTLGDAARMSDDDLRAINGIGPKALKAIRQAAADRGLVGAPT